MLTFLEDRHFLLLMLLLGTLFNIFWLGEMKERLGVRMPAVLLLSVLHTLYGVAAVMAFAVLETLKPSSFGSFSIFGAVFFMPLFYYAAAKILRRKAGAVFDAFTPCLLFTLMCARQNCIVSGCCLGKTIPWIADGALRWPTREIEIVFYFLFLAAAMPRIRENKTNGEIYPLYMTLYGILRFLTEFFRVSGTSSACFHLSHLWAAVSLLAGLSLYLQIRADGKRKKARHS